MIRARDAFAQHRVSRGVRQKLFLSLEIREGSEVVGHAPREIDGGFHYMCYAIYSFRGLCPRKLVRQKANSPQLSHSACTTQVEY